MKGDGGVLTEDLAMVVVDSSEPGHFSFPSPTSRFENHDVVHH